MDWSVVVIGAVGLLIGSRYRAPALIAATAAVVLGCVVSGVREITAIVELVLLLQCAYLTGLCLATLWRTFGGPRQ